MADTILKAVSYTHLDDYRITVGYGYDADEGKRLWMQTRATLCTGVLGTQGGTGLHPQALALVGVIAIAHRCLLYTSRCV